MGIIEDRGSHEKEVRGRLSENYRTSTHQSILRSGGCSYLSNMLKWRRNLNISDGIPWPGRSHSNLDLLNSLLLSLSSCVCAHVYLCVCVYIYLLMYTWSCTYVETLLGCFQIFNRFNVHGHPNFNAMNGWRELVCIYMPNNFEYYINNC